MSLDNCCKPSSIFCAVSRMTVVVPLSAFLRLILLLRFSGLIAFLSFRSLKCYQFEGGKQLKQFRVWFLPSNILEQPSFERVVARLI